MTMIMHEIFKLDPLSYVTLSLLSWEAAVKTSKIEIELRTDMNMLRF